MSMRLSAPSLSSQAHRGLTRASAFHLHTTTTILPCLVFTSGQASSPSFQTRSSCWWGHHRGRWWPHSESQERVPRRDRPYVHKCMPHRRREAWREQSPTYNMKGHSWGGRLGSWSWKDRGHGRTSGKEEGHWWDDSHRNLWKGLEAEHEHLDKEFENFKRRIDADPFGALFGRRLQRLNYHPHAPSFWTSISNSLFGANQEPTRSRTINVGKSTKDVNHKTSSTEKPTNPYTENGSTAETISEGSKLNSSSTADTSSPPSSFKFDPISGRMVPTTESTSTEPNAVGSVENDEGVDIPVKKYKAGQAQTGPQIPTTSVGEKKGSESDTGLQGSIGRPEDIQATPQRSRVSSIRSSVEDYQKAPSVKLDADAEHSQNESTANQILAEKQTNTPQSENPIWKFWKQPSLGSLLKRDDSERKNTPAEKMFPKRESFEDPRDEDLDILSASDIRASYGSMKAKQGIEEDKIKHREELEKDFESYHNAEQDINIQELRSRARGGKTIVNATVRPESERERIERENIDNLAEEIQRIYEDSYGSTNDSQSQVVTRRSSLAEEHAQAESPQAKEIGSSNADAHPATGMQDHTKLDNQAAVLTTAGHENCITPISRKVVGGLLEDLREFKESSSALLDDLAQTIDQVSSSMQAGKPERTASYRILAYDPSSSQVVDAEVTSSASSPEETPLSPDVFLDIENITKFLPSIAELNAEGYEVISATDGVLIFKQVRTVTRVDNSVSAPTALTSQVKQSETEPLDQSENDPTLPHPDPFSSSSPSSSPRVHRQETVFTGGPPNWSPYPPPPPVEPDSSTDHTSSTTGDGREKESFLHKTGRRVLLTGVATAGTCYALGVVSEYFRTGGEDGKGPDGFTAV